MVSKQKIYSLQLRLITGVFLFVSLFSASSAEASIRPGYQLRGTTIPWNDGQVLATVSIDRAVLDAIKKKGETIAGNVLPVYPTNQNIYFFTTVSYPDNGWVAFTVYTYHRGLGTIRQFYRDEERLDAGAPRSLEPVGVDGSKLILRRVYDNQKTISCSLVSQDLFLYTYRYDLEEITVTSKTKNLVAYTLPRDIFNRGQKRDAECRAAAADLNPPINNNTNTAPGSVVVPKASGVPVIGNCQMYAANSTWNKNLLGLTVRAESQSFVNQVGSEKNLQISFGSDAATGIPYNVVGDGTTWYDVRLLTKAQFSNPGPYPIPSQPLIEAGPARRMVVLDNNSCYYYEFLNARRDGNAGRWVADLISVFYTNTEWTRPQKWPSATASGIPLLPGLVKYDEVNSGAIRHPLLFTAPEIQKGFIYPASAGGTIDDGSYPAFGALFRLKHDYDTSKLSPQAKIIAQALKDYGMFLSDYGPAWNVLGTPDPRWDDKDLRVLNRIPGSAFEVVNNGTFVHVWFE